jgi:predicted transcriptional regulator
MNTRVITAHLPKELAQKLDGLADELDRPRGWLVKEAVEAYIALAEERRRETAEALAEVDECKVVGHAEVDAWAAGLVLPRKPKARPKRTKRAR